MENDFPQESPTSVITLPSTPSSFMLFTGAQKEEKKRNELHSEFLEEKSIKGQETPVAPSCKIGSIGSTGWKRQPSGPGAGH